MKPREVYVVSFGTLQVLVFFQLLSLAEQLVSFRAAYVQQIFIFLYGFFVSVSLFLLIQNISRVVDMIVLDEKDVTQKAKKIGEMSVHLLSFLLVCTLLKNFTF